MTDSRQATPAAASSVPPSRGAAGPWNTADAALARVGAKLRRPVKGRKHDDSAAPDAWLRPFTQRPAPPPPLPILNAALHLPEGDVALDRLFVSQPRTISFSHRPLLSMRHPYLRHVLLDDLPKRSTKGKTRRQSVREKMPTTKAQRLQPTSPQLMAEEERKWADLGHLFDVIALEDEVLQRRTLLLSADPFTVAVDRLWSHLVPTSDPYLRFQGYMRLHCCVWERFVAPVTSPAVSTVDADDSPARSMKAEQRLVQQCYTQSAAADWVVDSQGREGVPYESLLMSLYELTDNWVDNCSAEPYAAFILSILDDLESAVGSGETPAPDPSTVTRKVDGPKSTMNLSWQTKKQLVAANFQKGLFADCSGSRGYGLCRLRQRPNSSNAEYYMTPMQDLADIGTLLYEAQLST
eukprot:TRINITY_DN1200_c2_g1_i1.p1 TRINITY_DN1200_c2_g1~~TRINITY_DN1200_c2_g1_i1.p1  ORF type:complete len:425 (+),score=45.33 TRINITY_DN1200_c2_g1_i1:50-1276(+)